MSSEGDEDGRDKLEWAKFHLDEQRLTFERQKAITEDKRARSTQFTTAAAILISAASLIVTAFLTKLQISDSAETQALVAMVNSAYSQEFGADVTARLHSMAAVMGDRLSPQVQAQIKSWGDPQDFALNQHKAFMLIRLAAANPLQTPKIIALWRAAFPEDAEMMTEIEKRFQQDPAALQNATASP